MAIRERTLAVPERRVAAYLSLSHGVVVFGGRFGMRPIKACPGSFGRVDAALASYAASPPSPSRSNKLRATTCVARLRSSSSRCSSARLALLSSTVRGPAP